MKNKILMDDEVFILDDKTYCIKVLGNNKLFIKDTNYNVDLLIEMMDNSSLEILFYTTKSNDNKINIISNNNTNLKFRHSFDIKNKYNLILNNKIKGNNNKSDVLIKGISRGDVVIDVDGIVDNQTLDNELNETIKILMRDGKALIKPKLHVNNKNVIANHGNSISDINKSDLFYLMMKGIDKKTSIKLIEDGHKFGLFKDEDYLKIIKN